jgi:FMN phosphatase YigB (HAD superfamily)
MLRVASFDVFDTCITRACAVPMDAFLFVASRLADTLRPSLGERFEASFLLARTRAESLARRRHRPAEVTLRQIWDELCGILPMLDLEGGMEAELSVERTLARVNRQVLAAVDAARAESRRVVFISDTYLPWDFIRELLETNGFWRSGDGLYVSSQRGVTKSDGQLFKLMLEEEGILPKQLLHTGDDPRSDVLVPRRLGIMSRQETTCHLTPTERAVAIAGGTRVHATSRLSGEMRAYRVRVSTDEGTVERDFASSFLGPFLLTFASWVLSRAEQDGITRLYFVSRDCYLLMKVASVLSPLFGGIECRYLYISRQSLFLPTLSLIGPGGSPWLTPGLETVNMVRRLLSMLECEESTALGSSGSGGELPAEKVLETEADWVQFRALLGHGGFNDGLPASVESRRRAAQAYLRSCGMSEPVPWALVDLGWTLSSQVAIRQLLGLHDWQAVVRGYYLGLRHDRHLENSSGFARALFTSLPGDVGVENRGSSIFDRVALLEHVLGCAPHGSVRYYRESAAGVEPVCPGISDTEVSLKRGLERAVIEFAENGVRCGRWNTDGTTCAAVLDRLCNITFGTPKRAWVRLLANVQASADPNNLGASPIARPPAWKEVLASGCPQRLTRAFGLGTAQSSWWTEGDMALAGNTKRAVSMLGTTLWGGLRKLASRTPVTRWGGEC